MQAREALLLHVTETLKRDDRFVAAWLAGSYGRGELKWSSDLDLHVVKLGGYVPDSPRSIIEMRLLLLS